MDELRQLFEDFIDISDIFTHADFMRRFIRMMYTLMTMIAETLIDARDTHDRHELYSIIYEDTERIRRHLRMYIEVIESDSEEE